MRRSEKIISGTFHFAAAVLAAAICACSAVEETPAPISHSLYSILALHGAGASSLCDTLDVFIYDDEPGYPLDAYQHICCPDGVQSVSSTAGNKIAVFLANVPSSSIFYSDVIDFESINRMRYSIYDENPSSPAMCGITCFRAGNRSPFSVTLTPLLCRVELSSLSVEFSSEGLKGKRLENVRAYLTNVNGNCKICDSLSSVPTDLLNHGRYDPVVMSSLQTPSMLFCGNPCQGTEFFFYPSDCRGADPLSMPPTRLVIQGDIDGHTYYYPIEIGNGYTVRGRSYIFDVVITGCGTTDPDMPAYPASVNIQFRIKDWTENEEEVEKF